MATTAYVTYHQSGMSGQSMADDTLNRAVYSAALAISGTIANGAVLSQATHGLLVHTARVRTDDTACYVIVGVTPSGSAVVSTAASAARVYCAAGGEVKLTIAYGERVSVIAVS